MKKVDLAAKIAATAEQTKRSRQQCRVCSLPPEWLEGVHGARDKHNTEFTGISRSLKAEGFIVSDNSIRRHFQSHR